MTFGNSFAYFNNMSFGNCYNSLYSRYSYGNSGSALFGNPFDFGMTNFLYSGYNSVWTSALYTPTNFSLYNPFAESSFGYNLGYGYTPSYYGYNLGYNSGYNLGYNGGSNWRSANYGNVYSGYDVDSNSLYGRFMSLTAKSANNSAKVARGSDTVCKGPSMNVGTAKNITAYTTKNKQENAGKLSGVSNFKDLTGRVNMCNPDVVDTLVALSKEAEKHGCKIVVSSSFRTYSEQVNLVGSKGQYGKKGKNGKVGVAAAAGTSPHEYGQAIDFAVYKGNQKITISERNTPWVISCLKNHSMTWGGYYKTVPEPWHFNTSNASSYRAKLKSGSMVA